MAIDKAIDYVEQDGSLNFIKNSKSVTVPKEFKARKNAPATKLAYITDAEAKMLKKKKPGTPHKGPKGIPSYDSYGSIDKDTGKDVGVSGVATSAAETGSRNPRDIREMQSQFNTANLGPGVIPEQAKDYRSAFIAAGGGQRVNPSFFDSRDTVSPEELARAKAFNPTAFKTNRRGGIMDFIRGGGFLGAIIRNIGQRLGYGKKFNEPTYDMSEFNKLTLGGVDPFANIDIRDIFDRRNTGGITNTVPFDANTFDDDVNLMNTKPTGTTTFFEDEFPSTERPLPDYGNPTNDYRVVPEEMGLVGDRGIMSVASSDVAPEFRNMITRTGMNETQKKMIDSAANMYGKVNPGDPLDKTTQQEIFDSVKKFDTKAKDKTLGLFGGQEADPLTKKEYKDYLISQGYI